MSRLIGILLNRLRFFGPRTVAVVVTSIAFLTANLVADDGKPDFTRDILPILKRSCFECHGVEKQKGNLRLDSKLAAFKGGDSGDVIRARHPADSALLRRVQLPQDDPEVMPARGNRLTQNEIAILRDWIAHGAEWPEDIGATSHWAYRKPVPVAARVVKNVAWPKNEADRFILQRLETENWEPSPEANRTTLIRRVSLDLVGLPPTIAEVDEFLHEDRDDAYERLVDRLLASPLFGEKWARPWLDLARYADSHGFQRDDLRELWAYRDWVIRALNDDMPFDRFSIEQIAGDLLPNAGQSQRIATGFHRCTTTNVEAGSEPEETRVNQVFDRVNTTGTIWLGTTLECAQCHDHKYDPFSQQDYYRLFAFFNNTAIEAERTDPKVPSSIRFLGPSLPLPDPVLEEKQAKINVELTRLNQQRSERRKEVVADQPHWESALAKMVADAPQALPSDVVEIAKTASDKRTEKQKERLVDFQIERDAAGADLIANIKKLNEQLLAVKTPSTLVMNELEARRQSHLFQRGNYLETGIPVQPGTPAILHPLPEGAVNRLAVAQWLVSRENPLVARVTVNRWWVELFGRGLVGTVEDFGVKGDLPTHPELLDWLALEFIDHDWSQKEWLRTVVTSATYRQSSYVTRPYFERDPENKLYSRGPRYRVDAESIRDNVLAISGLLSVKIGGPPVRPYQPDGLWTKIGGEKIDYVISAGEDRYRRAIYVVWKRSNPYPSFVNFDAPARMTCIPKRSRSNTPLQALTLLNDPVYVEAAMALAKRIVVEISQSTEIDRRIEHAFRLCLSRRPTSSEISTLKRLHDLQLAEGHEKQDAVQQLLAGIDLPQTVGPIEFAAWYSVASALLNLDEVITKE